MIVRTSALNSTRRTLALDNQPLVRRTAVSTRSQVDSFQAASPVAAPLVAAQSAQTVAAPTSTSSGGIKGFFSGLWGRIKNVASGLLGQAGQYVTNNMGGWITKATDWVSQKVGGLLTKAGSWFTNLLSGWAQKLQS